MAIQEDGNEAMYLDLEIPVPSPKQQTFFQLPVKAQLRDPNRQQRQHAVHHQEAAYSDAGQDYGEQIAEEADFSFDAGHIKQQIAAPAMLPSAVKHSKPGV